MFIFYECSFAKRLQDRVEEHEDVVLHYGKHVSEAFSTMACECGRLHRHLGASKVFTCPAPVCARHGPGVSFDRDRRAARQIAVLNAFRVYKRVRVHAPAGSMADAAALLLGLRTAMA